MSSRLTSKALIFLFLSQKLAALFIATTAAFDLDATDSSAQQKWGHFKSQFNKDYKTVEADADAFEKFAATEARILAHNKAGDTW